MWHDAVGVADDYKARAETAEQELATTRGEGMTVDDDFNALLAENADLRGRLDQAGAALRDLGEAVDRVEIADEAWHKVGDTDKLPDALGALYAARRALEQEGTP